MDFQQLLRKYIAHVISVNADSYIEVARITPHYNKILPVFTEEEIELLELIEKEARKEFTHIN